MTLSLCSSPTKESGSPRTQTRPFLCVARVSLTFCLAVVSIYVLPSGEALSAVIELKIGVTVVLYVPVQLVIHVAFLARRQAVYTGI